MMIRTIAIASALVTLGITGCKSEVTLGGVASSKPVNTLTPDEATAVCTDAAADLTLTEDEACTVFGIAATSIEGMDCPTAKASCLKDNSAPIPQNSPAVCVTALKTCAVTVGEFAECANAFSDQLRGLNCSSTLASVLDMPEVCKTIVTKCPGSDAVGPMGMTSGSGGSSSSGGTGAGGAGG